MLRTVGDQPSLWESLLPAELLVLPVELARVDALLDDPVFFTPFVGFFDDRLGRPSIPLETYLRMMFLKFRYQLSFESVCREVADSISWQRFCRISFGSRVPHPTTLMKITTRCGDAAVTGLNQALLAKAVDAKLVKTDKVRADTTVVEADVSYPTDSGLLAKGVTRQAIADAQAVVRNGRRAAKKASGQARGRLKRAVKDLDILLQRTARVVAQTRIRLAGDTPDSATRLVSLHDPDARPIAKGRLGKPVEFGYKAQVVDNVDGIILDHSVEIGNPADGPQLVPAIDRIKQLTRKTPRAVTADRGYGDAAVQQGLEDLGVSYVAIPRKGKPSQARRQIEHRRAFQEKVKWRTGSEGRISHLKRNYGWNRTRLVTIEGARTWCGHGVFTHNLIKISKMAA